MSEFKEKTIKDLNFMQGDTIDGVGNDEEIVLEYKLLEYMDRMSTPLSLAKVKELIKHNKYLNINDFISEYKINNDRFLEFRRRILNSKIFELADVLNDKNEKMEGIVLNKFYSSLYKDIVEIKLLPNIFHEYSNKTKNVYNLIATSLHEDISLYNDFLLLVDEKPNDALDFIVNLCIDYNKLSPVTSRKVMNRDCILDNIKKQNKIFTPLVTENKNTEKEDVKDIFVEDVLSNHLPDGFYDIDSEPTLLDFLTYIKENREKYSPINYEQRHEDLMSLDGELFELYKILFKKDII